MESKNIFLNALSNGVSFDRKISMPDGSTEFVNSQNGKSIIFQKNWCETKYDHETNIFTMNFKALRNY